MPSLLEALELKYGDVFSHIYNDSHRDKYIFYFEINLHILNIT